MLMPVLSVRPASCVSRRFQQSTTGNKKGRNPRAGIPAFAVGG